MNFRKILALLLSLALCFGVFSAVGAENAGTKAVDPEKRLGQLLSFTDELHAMKTAYAPRIADKASSADDPYANARIIVKCAHSLDYSGSVAHVSGYNDWHIIQYATPEQAEQAAAKYRSMDGVAYAAPDQIMSLAQQPHENSFLSWGYGEQHVNAFNYNEWILGQVDGVSDLPEIIVAVLDTGVDSDHPFLAGRLVSGGYDFANNDSDPEDDHYHGTHVSGTIVDGTLPNVKVMGIKVLDSGGYGDTTDICNGMEYANLHGCMVANLSLRGPKNSDSYQMYSEVINNGTDNGTIYCVASGNDSGSSEDWVPACVSRAFTVAAHGSDHSMAYFSNVGPSVDITAPGVDINSASPGGGYRILSGTSMATPHVAAACAMLLSFDPDLAPDEAIGVIKRAAVDEGLSGGGTGLLNVTDLVKYDSVLNGEGSELHFTSGGQYPWATAEGYAYSTNAGAAGSSSVLTSSVSLGAYQQITFEYKVSSEENHDYFRFKVNGSTRVEASGETGWQTYTEIIPESGTTVLTWEFAKDSGGNAGDDTACVRNVVLSKTISTVMNGGDNDFLFESDGNYPWTVDGDAAKSGNAGVHNTVSEAIANAHIEAGLTVFFLYRTECGLGDKLQFLVNGEVQLEVTATTDWTAFEYSADSTGDYTLTFRYIKDGSGSTGADSAWIKGVELIYSISAALNVPGGTLAFDNSGSYPWVVEGDNAKSGNRGMANTTSTLGLDVGMHAGDTLSFRYKVSSESNYDWFNFTVNGSQILHYSGNQGWAEYTYTAQSDGSFHFAWSYSKDSSVNNGDDCAYLDDVRLTVVNNFLPGDSNSNGTIEASDALLAMRYSMGLIGPNMLDLDAADINGDGTVAFNDALIILRIAMGIRAE